MLSLRQLLSPVLVLVLAAVYHGRIAAALDIRTLFTVSFNPFDPGTCSPQGLTEMNLLVTEALEMAGAGVAAAADGASDTAATWEEANRLVNAFFRLPSTAGFTTIKRSFQAVQFFLNNGGTINGGASSLTPFLFCGDSWAIRQEMSDQMYSKTGVLMTKADGSIFQIQDDPDFVTAQAAVAATLGQPAYPYYSKTIGGYVFDQKYATDPTVGYCSGLTNTNGHLGAAFSRGAQASILILCPGSFTGTRVRQVVAAPIQDSLMTSVKPPAGVPTQRIIDVMPEVSTFFHELFHLVEGGAVTVPTGGEEYKLRTIMGVKPRPDGSLFTSAQSIDNPESYTFAAVAYDYTLNAPLVNNLHIEYFTGYCTIHQ